MTHISCRSLPSCFVPRLGVWVLFLKGVLGTANSTLVSKLSMFLRIVYRVSSSFCRRLRWRPYTPPPHLLGVQGYIGYQIDNSTIILAFRGSSNFQNWIVDFSFPLVQFDGLPAGAKVMPCRVAQSQSSCSLVTSYQVHWGFYQAFSRLKMRSRAAVAHILEVHFMFLLARFFRIQCDIIVFAVVLTPSPERLSALLNRHCNRSQFGCCSRRTLCPRYRCCNFNHLKSHLAKRSCTALVYTQRDQLTPITTACITFGMPRTGNRAWAQAFNQIVGLNFRFWPMRFTRSFYHYLFLPSE